VSYYLSRESTDHHWRCRRSSRCHRNRFLCDLETDAGAFANASRSGARAGGSTTTGASRRNATAR